MTHLLDTDHLTLIQWQESRERTAIVANINLCSGDVGVPVVSFHEQAMGCNNEINQARTEVETVEGYERLQKVISCFAGFLVVPYDEAAAKEFVRLRKAKVRIGTMDLRIAATALSRDLTLVTRNRADFDKVPGLRLVDWTR